MNLVASLVVRNELGRYLQPCIEHLLEFCDMVVVLDDASDDGTREALFVDRRVQVAENREPTFFKHEGRTRQKLLDFTLSFAPTHVLSIDADEFVDDGAELRRQLEAWPDAPLVPLLMQEVWSVDTEHDSLLIREDGGWRSHPLPYLWRVDPNVRYRIMDRALACRRVPTQVFRLPASSLSQVSLLHFGWANEAEREARHARYVKHDGGRFHNRKHLDSIMWDDKQVTLSARPWPEGQVFDGLRERFSAVAA